jgi:anti-sigma-K factor RskA
MKTTTMKPFWKRVAGAALAAAVVALGLGVWLAIRQRPAPLAPRPSTLTSPVSYIGDCDVALTLSAPNNGRTADFALF